MERRVQISLTLVKEDLRRELSSDELETAGSAIKRLLPSISVWTTLHQPTS